FHERICRRIFWQFLQGNGQFLCRGTKTHPPGTGRNFKDDQMNTFWTTLLEINLVLTIVYLGYRLLLKNLTFFRWNRVYLLCGMLLGLLYPFLKSNEVIPPTAEAMTLTLPDFSARIQ